MTPQTASEWFEHLRAQLRGEAEPIPDTTEPEDQDMNPPSRRDWQ